MSLKMHDHARDERGRYIANVGMEGKRCSFEVSSITMIQCQCLRPSSKTREDHLLKHLPILAIQLSMLRFETMRVQGLLGKVSDSRGSVEGGLFTQVTTP